MKQKIDIYDLWNLLQEIDTKLDRIAGQVPPVTPKPEPLPEPIEPIDDTVDLDALLSYEGIQKIHVPKGTWLKVKSKGKIKPKAEGLIADGIYLQFTDWEQTPTQLIDCEGKDSFFIKGIQFVCPPNRPIKTAFPSKQVFGWERDKVESGKFAWIDAPEVKDKDLVTFGLAWFCYSSKSDEKIYLIGKGLNHNGFNFMQAKNPYKGNLYTALIDVNIHNPIIRKPQTHYYTPTDIKCQVEIKDGIARIVSDHTFDQILTWHGYYKGNIRSILHVDGGVFIIKDENIIDDKTLKLENELQAGDIVGGKKIIRKQLDLATGQTFNYDTIHTTEPYKRKVFEGKFDAYIVYKGNSMFSNGRMAEDTAFGDWAILQSAGYGWTWYSSVTGYIENYYGQGYHRDSGDAIDYPLTIRNSWFEKNRPKARGDNDLDKNAQEFITYIEKLN